MVRHRLNQTPEQSPTHTAVAAAAEAQGPQAARAPSPPQQQQQQQEQQQQEPGAADTHQQEATERQLDLSLWHSLSLEEEPESWQQLQWRGGLPTHFRPFTCRAEFELVTRTFHQLQHSGYYWGPMAMEEAHHILKCSKLGTFLIRDSGQSDIFFTLSYQSEQGPTSVRVQLKTLLFNLHGSHKKFPSFFALLAHYTGSSCKLTAPYRRQRPESLRQMCRRALVRAYGAERVGALLGLSRQVKDYVGAYPHHI